MKHFFSKNAVSGNVKQTEAPLGIQFIFTIFCAAFTISCNTTAVTLTGVLPSRILTSGDFISVLGTGFSEQVQILIDEVPCQNPVHVSAEQINCKAPRHNAGSVVVRAIHLTTHQEATLPAEALTYYAPAVQTEPAPTLIGMRPDTGPASGGTRIEVSGTGFRDGITVRLGSSMCGDLTLVSDRFLTCTTTAHPAATVDAIVQNTDGMSGSLVGAYSYAASVRTSQTREYVFASRATRGGIERFEINLGNGTLQELGSVTIDGLSRPGSILQSPNGRYLFISQPSTNSLFVLQVNPRTGDLSSTDNYNFPGFSGKMAINHAGSMLFLLMGGSFPSISGYSIHADGTLTLATSYLFSGGTATSLAISPDDTSLVVAGSSLNGIGVFNCLVSFGISAAGELSLGSSIHCPVYRASAVQFSHDGGQLAVGTDAIDFTSIMIFPFDAAARTAGTPTSFTTLRDSLGSDSGRADTINNIYYDPSDRALILGIDVSGSTAAGAPFPGRVATYFPNGSSFRQGPYVSIGVGPGNFQLDSASAYAVSFNSSSREIYVVGSIDVLLNATGTPSYSGYALLGDTIGGIAVVRATF